jgi:hypothetical protein
MAAVTRGLFMNSFVFFMSSRPILGSIQPPIQWVTGGALSPGLKRPGRETDRSPSFSAEVKKTWMYTPTLPYTLTWRSA